MPSWIYRSQHVFSLQTRVIWICNQHMPVLPFRKIPALVWTDKLSGMSILQHAGAKATLHIFSPPFVVENSYDLVFSQLKVASQVQTAYARLDFILLLPALSYWLGAVGECPMVWGARLLLIILSVLLYLKIKALPWSQVWLPCCNIWTLFTR